MLEMSKVMSNIDTDTQYCEVRNINCQRVCDMSDDRTAIVIRRKDTLAAIHIADGYIVVDSEEKPA